MPERFEAVVRERYGVKRRCVKDHETGQLAIFVDETDTTAFAWDWNSNPDLASPYVWTKDIDATPGRDNPVSATKHARGCEYCWWFSGAHRWAWVGSVAWFIHARTYDHRRETAGKP